MTPHAGSHEPEPLATKGERTRRRILEEAAVLFSARGRAGTSMADVTERCGLEKGGVYNHFASKDELSLAAFEFDARRVLDRFAAATRGVADPVRRLRNVVDLYLDPMPGGCPLMNTAIEADHERSALRTLVRASMREWHAILATAVKEAVTTKAFAPCDPDAFASTTIACIEGGVMLASLQRDMAPLRAVVDHLHRTIDGQLLTPMRRSKKGPA